MTAAIHPTRRHSAGLSAALIRAHREGAPPIERASISASFGPLDVTASGLR
jgi:hypothetical protein